MNKVFNIIISGVGGQGLITLNQIIAEAALVEGYDVKTSELHGLSQRGGSVETHIRFGEKIYSPLITNNRADLILAFEISEGLRANSYANKNTIFLINNHYIPFIGGLTKEEIKKRLNVLPKNKLYLISASEICKKELKNEVVSGIYLLGYAVYKKLIPLGPQSLLGAISKIIPENYLELNKKAFQLSRNLTKIE